MNDAKKASVRVQWSDTDACLHFTCECGAEFHMDRPDVQRVRCSQCYKVWKLPEYLELEASDEPATYEGDES